jgi:hypothetical protein
MEDICFKINTKPLKDIAILIPAYNPDDKLIILVNELIKVGVGDIIVVDDGSELKNKYIFEAIKTLKHCTVLQHAVNLGKGRALKTAFNYFSNNYKGFIGLVTVDADGQHNCEDIIKVAQLLQKYPDNLIMGTRNFRNGEIPLRSRLGNIITSKVFNFFSGINISDTQTGLRGISYNNILSMLKINGEKYEFEMNMLIECAQKEIDIKEVEIDTIYTEGNKSSHFNPLVDSLRIYVVFLKFIFSSFSSFFVDILSFVIFTKLFILILPKYFILMATIGSRIVSSAFNYLVNRKAVFSSKNYKGNTIAKYYILALIQMFISALGVSLLYNQFHQGEVVIKMIVDSLLFVTSFRVQRDWVFIVENK